MITTQRTTPHDLSRILNDGPTDKEVAAGKGEKPASQHYRHVCGRGEESVVPRTELEDAFQKTDTDGNGQLSKEELRSSLTKHFFEWLGREVPDKNLNRLYKSLGGDTQMGVRFEKTDKPARFLRTTRFESKLETGRQPTCFDIESPVAWMWRDAPTLHPRANLINNICPVLGKENGETDSCYDDAPQCRDLMESGLANCGDAWAMKMCRHTCRTCTLNCQKGHFDHGTCYWEGRSPERVTQKRKERRDVFRDFLLLSLLPSFFLSIPPSLSLLPCLSSSLALWCRSFTPCHSKSLSLSLSLPVCLAPFLSSHV